MRRNTLFFLTLAALLVGMEILFGTGGVSAQTNAGSDPISGLITWIEPKGGLKIKQANGVPPVNATEGMLVRRGYLLTLDPTARAEVICGDGKKRELAPGPHGSPCTRPCTPEVCGIRYDGSTISPMRGLDTEKGIFPVVISPRKTMLRNLRPTILWAPIAGAKTGTTYQVILYGDAMKMIWTREVVSKTRLTYPDKEPSLIPGQTYKVVVTSDGLSSQQDNSPGLGFTTLTADQARALADQEIKRRQLELPETQTRFLVSNLFAARELYGEAIEQLQSLYPTMKVAPVAKLLGDLYASIGLSREAEKKYLEALNLTPANDLDGRGLTEKNLAQVYENLGRFDQAIALLRKARRAYRRLGNRAMVNALLNDEQRLRKAGGRL